MRLPMWCSGPGWLHVVAAQVGVDDEVVGANGSVVFEIWVDGIEAGQQPASDGG